MARSRLGGARRLKSGAVGNVVYQIRTSDNGQRYQVVGEKPTDKALALTPALARQRLLMSVIMHHMSLLKPFMDACSEYVPEGTLSVQEFVRLNLKRLAELADSPQPWYRDTWWPLYGEQLALPTPLLITEGSVKNWSLNVVDLQEEDGVSWAVIQFGEYGQEWTWNEWCNQWKLYPGNYAVVLFFVLGDESSPSAYRYVRFKLSESVPMDKKITNTGFQRYFETAGDFTEWTWHYKTGLGGWRWWELESPHDTQLNRLTATCDLLYGYLDGKRFISESFLDLQYIWGDMGVTKYSYDEAFYSWYDERI